MEKYLDIKGAENENVLHYAFINSYFQTGLKDLIDEAVLKHEEAKEKLNIGNLKKIDELPFDFNRRRMSVIVGQKDKKNLLICKGAVEEIFDSCSSVLVDNKVVPLSNFSDIDKFSIEKELNEEGFRVIAVAYKEVDSNKTVFN